MDTIENILSLRRTHRRVILLQILSFAAMGAGMPFQSLYFKHTLLRADGTPAYALIGLLFFVQAAAGMIGTPIAGYIADRFKVENRILFICSLMVVLSSLLLAMPSLVRSGSVISMFPVFLAGMAVNGLFFRPVTPVVDTETLEYLHTRYGNADNYGRVRLFGSLAWAVSSILFGAILWKSNLFILTILGYGAGFLALAAVAKSGFRAKISSVRIPWEHLKKDSMYKSMLFFAFFMGVAVNTSFNFTSYLMEDARAGYFEMGLAFGLAALPELPIMYASRRIKALVGNRGMLVLGSLFILVKLVFLVAVARSGNTWLFILVHSLHGVGYSLFLLGIIDLMDKRAHEDLRAMYQNLFYLVWSFAVACGSLFAGFMIGRYGNTSLMGADAAITAGALAYFLFFVRGHGSDRGRALQGADIQ